MKMFVVGFAASALMTTGALAQETPPDIVRAMIESAVETGDPARVSAVADAAKDVFPDFADAIDVYAAPRIAELTPPEPVAETDAVAEAPKPTGGLFALSPWEGKAVASAAVASGNSENVAVGFLVEGRRESGDFAHNVSAYLDIGSSGGVQNQKRWGAAYQLDYAFSERTYAYGRFSFDEDEFSGFDYRLFAGAGLGHFIAKSDAFTWKIEGGPGFQYSPIDDTREISENFALYAASETDWVIRDGIIFEQDFNVTWTDPTTTFISTSSLTSALTDALATGVSFQYRHETNPPLGRAQDDTIFRANLTYGF